MAAQADTLDKTVRFLAKREGIDKTLKIIRYTARFITAVAPAGGEVAQRFDALQSSIGTSRKAYRLGKFLQNLNNLRKVNITQPLSTLEIAAHVGEGIYYFAEQLTWLIKAGFLNKTYEKKISKISAYAETVSYVASIWLHLYRISLLNDRARQIMDIMQREKIKNEEANYHELEKELRVVEHLRAMRYMFIMQDVADFLLTLPDLRGESNKSILGNPAFLAAAGLLSGCISSYKNWNT